MDSLLRLKLTTKTARKLLLEAHRWTEKEALADNIVDAMSHSNETLNVAVSLV
jgi:hypothetical protein